uniref:Uncharacterized protein n=1 Tax=Rhizophora mucronata TaxID=61149 RepID=A0A2P2M007_RHIMU
MRAAKFIGDQANASFSKAMPSRFFSRLYFLHSIKKKQDAPVTTRQSANVLTILLS